MKPAEVALGTCPHTLPLYRSPVAKNGEQGMLQVYDVLSTHESRFAPTAMPVNPSRGAGRESLLLPVLWKGHGAYWAHWERAWCTTGREWHCLHSPACA